MKKWQIIIIMGAILSFNVLGVDLTLIEAQGLVYGDSAINESAYSVNYGSDLVLTASNGDDPRGGSQMFYMLFNFSNYSITSISLAEVILHVSRCDTSGGAFNLTVYYANDSFGESTITWANHFTEIANVNQTLIYQNNTANCIVGNNVTIDVFSQVNREINDDKIFTLIFNRTSGSNSSTPTAWAFDSSENATYAPYLNLSGTLGPLNTVPNISSSLVVLNTTSVYNYTSGNLTFYNSSAAYDSDGDSTRLKLRWYRNNILNSTWENKTLVTAGNTTKGDGFIVEVIPFDGTAYGTAVNTSNLSIDNSPPNGFSAFFLNTTSIYNYTTANLTFYNTSAVVDNDSDSTKFMLRWYNYSLLQNDLENNTIVTAGNTSKHQGWIVEVWPFDGTIYGSPANSTNLTINNTPPVATVPVVLPVVVFENVSLNATSTYSDADVDVGSLWFRWFVNGIMRFSQKLTGLASGGSAVSNLSYGNFSAFDNVSVEVVSEDSEPVNGTRVNSSINISNYAPTISFTPVLNSSNYNYTSGDLWCLNSSAAFDKESNSTKLIIRWYNQSVVASNFENNTILRAANLSRSQNWTCEVFASDGYNLSNKVNSTSLVVNDFRFMFNISVPSPVPTNTRFYASVNVTQNYSSLPNFWVNFTLKSPDGLQYIDSTNSTGVNESSLWNSTRSLNNVSGIWEFTAKAYNSYHSSNISWNVTSLEGVDILNWFLSDDSLGNNITLYINFSRTSALKWVNVSVKYPNGTFFVTNQGTTINKSQPSYEVRSYKGIFLETNGSYYSYNVTGENNLMNFSFSYGTFRWSVQDVWYYAPEGHSETLVSSTSVSLWNISFRPKTLANLTYNFSIKSGDTTTNFTYAINSESSNITNSSIFFNNLSFVPASTLTNGTYEYNITILRPVQYGIASRNVTIPFTLYAFPPSGDIQLMNSSMDLCSATSGNCYKYLSKYIVTEPEKFEYFIYNAGGFVLSNCAASLSGKLSGITYSTTYIPNISIGENVSFNVSIAFETPGIFYGDLNISCYADAFANRDSLTPDMRPFFVVFSSSTSTGGESFGSAGGGGGGGASPMGVVLPVTNVTVPSCGDGKCQLDAGEDKANCAKDCGQLKINLDSLVCISLKDGKFSVDKSNCLWSQTWFFRIALATALGGAFLLVFFMPKKDGKRNV